MMLKSTLLMCLTAAAVALGEKTVARRQCGVAFTDAEVLAKESHFQANRVARPFLKADTKLTANIPVHFHVVTGNNDRGAVQDSQIQAQIDVLNEDYAPTGLTFSLANITHTVNNQWHVNAGIQSANDVKIQDAMKKALRVGGPDVFNVYTVGFANSAENGLLGYATFPDDYAGKPYDDGVVIHFGSLPGGDLAPYNLGRTLTHEGGHWLGLFHTFQGGCSGVGDQVSDTPPEAQPAFGCPVGRDTCSGGGVDPIHNYMDYSDDECLTEFSAGQIVRLADQIRTYRGINI